MKTSASIGMVVVTFLVCLPSLSMAEQPSSPRVTDRAPGAPVFPPSEKCTSSAPCTNVAGELLRIEESYWIKDAQGREVHLKAKGDSNMKELPKVGDNIAAQLDSTGNIQALVKLPKAPKAPKAEVPSKTMEDLR